MVDGPVSRPVGAADGDQVLAGDAVCMNRRELSANGMAAERDHGRARPRPGLGIADGYADPASAHSTDADGGRTRVDLEQGRPAQRLLAGVVAREHLHAVDTVPERGGRWDV